MRGEYPGASLWTDEAVNNFLRPDKGSCITRGDSIFVKLKLGAMCKRCAWRFAYATAPQGGCEARGDCADPKPIQGTETPLARFFVPTFDWFGMNAGA